MSKKTRVSLPHPVLGNADDVSGSITVSISAILNDDASVLTLKGDLTINNDYFNELIGNKKIAPAYKIISPGTLFADCVIGPLDKALKCNLLSWKVEIEAYLVAVDEISDFSHSSFNEDFMIGDPYRKFSVDQGMIIGFGGITNIWFDTVYLNNLSGIIEFCPVSEDDPISFDTDGQKIVIKYPKKEGDVDIVNMLSQKTSKFKDNFLHLFILPALAAAYDALKKADEANSLSSILEQHTWASVIDSLDSDWEGKDSFVLAQQFLRKMIARKQQITLPVPVPVISAYKEMEKFMR